MELLQSISSSASSLPSLNLEGHPDQKFTPAAPSIKVHQCNYTGFKFKKLKLEDKKYFSRLQRLVAAKKKTTIQSSLPVDSMAPGLYHSDDEDQTDESDLD